MTPCPACDNPVDPLRSRFVGVRDGNVVAYCSAECAAGRPRATTERAMSPASGVPVRIPTPPAGVPPLAGPPDGLGGLVDSGPVILQRAIPVLEGDTPESLAFRVFEQECVAYPEAVRLFAAGRLRIEGRLVHAASDKAIIEPPVDEER